MFVKKITDCDLLEANDGCMIRELLHPKNDAVELPYSIAVATVTQDQQSYAHKLVQDEVYYILTGQGRLYIDNESSPVSKGEVFLIPANSVQWIENTGDSDLVFLAIVSPPWTKEGDIRIN